MLKISSIKFLFSSFFYFPLFFSRLTNYVVLWKIYLRANAHEKIIALGVASNIDVNISNIIYTILLYFFLLFNSIPINAIAEKKAGNKYLKSIVHP